MVQTGAGPACRRRAKPGSLDLGRGRCRWRVRPSVALAPAAAEPSLGLAAATLMLYESGTTAHTISVNTFAARPGADDDTADLLAGLRGVARGGLRRGGRALGAPRCGRGSQEGAWRGAGEGRAGAGLRGCDGKVQRQCRFSCDDSALPSSAALQPAQLPLWCELHNTGQYSDQVCV